MTRIRLQASFITLAVGLALPLPTYGQSTLDNPMGEYVEYPLTIGPLDNAGAEPLPLGDVVSLDGAAWIRVYFGEVALAPGSTVRVTSLLDEEVQELDAAGLAMWSNSSAYLNGDTLLLELVAAPGTTANRIAVDRIAFERVPEGAVRGGSGQCGICGTDDRTASSEDWVGRLMPVGCSSSVFNTGSCLISAGHCMTGGLVAQFRVPNTSANCTPQNPPVADQFPVIQTQQQNNGVGADWAVLRTGTNNLGQKIFERYGQFRPIATTVGSVGNPVDVFGYGVDFTCTVSQTQRRSPGGSITARTSTWYEYNADVRGGNSGSPLMRNNEIIAVVTHCSFGCPNYGTRVDVGAFANARNNLCPGCDEDLNGDGAVGLEDVSLLLANYGCTGPSCIGDINHDGVTGLEDLTLMLAAYGQPCG